MRRSSLAAPLVALIVVAGTASRACACSCVERDFYAAFAGSDAVFLGEVIDISTPGTEYPPRVSVTIRVETAWKGTPAPSTTSIVTSASSASCGFQFRVGGRYLVYADRFAVPPSPDELWAGLCTRTHESAAGDPDLALLNSPLPSLKLTVSPNPSLRSARLTWSALGNGEQQARVRLEILDFQGRRIRTLVDGPASAGAHESWWDGRNDHGAPAPLGIYWVRFTFGEHVTTSRLVRLGSEP